MEIRSCDLPENILYGTSGCVEREREKERYARIVHTGWTSQRGEREEGGGASEKDGSVCLSVFVCLRG